MSFERVKTVTAPSDLPLTVQDVKDYLRIEGNIDDEVVLNCLRSAADWVSSPDGCGYALMKQRWAYYPPQLNELDYTLHLTTNHWHIRLPGWPLNDTTGEIHYTLAGDSSETVSSVTLSNQHQAKSIYALRPTTGWPTGREKNAPVTIEYEVGHSDRSKIPHDMKMAVRILASRFYENRGSAEPDTGIDRIIAKYRRWA